MSMDTWPDSVGGQPPEALAEPALQMNTEQAAALLRTTALETNAAVLLSFDSMEPRKFTQINDAMLDLQDGQAIYQPANNYYPQICQRLAESLFPPIDCLPADPDANLPKRYVLNAKGYHIDRRVAAQLLQWGLTFNIPLRLGLSPPRAAAGPNEQPSNLTRLAVLSQAVRGRTLYTDDLHAAFPLYSDAQPFYNHCRKLTETGFMERRGTGFLLKKEHLPAFRQLLDLFGQAVTLDPAFYREGQELADRLAANPEAMRYLIKRANATSGLSGQRVSYRELTDEAIDYIHQQPEAVSLEAVAKRLGLAGDKSRTKRLYKALATAGLRHAGDHKDALLFGASHNSTPDTTQ